MAALRIEFIEMQLQPVTGNAAAHASALPTLCFFFSCLPCKSTKISRTREKKNFLFYSKNDNNINNTFIYYRLSFLIATCITMFQKYFQSQKKKRFSVNIMESFEDPSREKKRKKKNESIASFTCSNRSVTVRGRFDQH